MNITMYHYCIIHILIHIILEKQIQLITNTL